MPLLFRAGLLLAFTAICLQVAVFLQPLLPKQYQIAPVCETITQALFISKISTDVQSSAHSSHHHSHQFEQDQVPMPKHDHHDPNHQCQYCTVYANLVLPPDLGVKEVLVRIQIRLIAYQHAFKHVYFALQRLFLLPQGRAPPLFA